MTPKEVVYTATVRSAKTKAVNLCATDLNDDPPEFVKSKNSSTPDDPNGETPPDNKKPDLSIPVFDATHSIGRTFLMDQQADGQRFRAKIVELVEAHEGDIINHPDRLKYVCSVDDDTAEEIFTYNKLMDYLAKDEENLVYWKMKQIVLHQGPIRENHPDWKGSTYNVMIKWENGEIASEPLTNIAADDLCTRHQEAELTQYARPETI